MNTFETNQKYDRVVSVEMFEHMRNWHQLLERIHSWLTNEGCLFIHIFVHRELAYLFDGQGGVNWMAEHFFKEGMMPAESLLPLCNQHLITSRYGESMAPTTPKHCALGFKKSIKIAGGYCHFNT